MPAHDLLRATACPCADGVHRRGTALEFSPRASRELGVELWVKREDRADDFGAGHKARKLSYLIADAMSDGATVLVTAASLPSGQASGIAGHAPAHGLRAHVVYCGDEQRRPGVPCGNYLLTVLLGATITWRELSAWDAWPEYVGQAADAERARGERPYVVPPGMSTWPGILGTLELGAELAEQLPRDGATTHIVCAAGSGGTALGLAVTGIALGLPWHVHGVCIAASADATARELAMIAADTAQRLPALPVDAATVHLHNGAQGAGYDRPTWAEYGMMRHALAAYGLALDPVYLAKAMIGLRQLVDQGSIPAGARTVLIHTGATISLFNHNPALPAWAASALGPYLAVRPDVTAPPPPL